MLCQTLRVLGYFLIKKGCDVPDGFQQELSSKVFTSFQLSRLKYKHIDGLMKVTMVEW